MKAGINIGRFKLTPLEFGQFRLDGGAMFGVVPRVLWEKLHPADDKNRIQMVMRCLLIEFDDRKVLVDTGFGNGRAEKFRKIFNYEGSDSPIVDSLADVGVLPTEITDVILTHLHFDHCGGSTIDKTGDPRPAFPNARYYIQQQQLTHARSLLERDKASYLSEDFEPLIEHGVASLMNGPWELAPGINMLVFDGHTPAQQLVKIAEGDEVMLYAGDLIPLASQFQLPWIMAYDLYPVITLREKKKLLTQAADEDWTFFFEHDPRHITGRVILTDKGFFLRD